MIPQSESSHYEHTTDPRAFLEHFLAPRRSVTANWFHDAVRGGATTPATVLHQVHQTVQRRLHWASPQTDVAHLQTVLTALQEDRDGALAHAQSVIDYERLPYEARQRMKAERANPYLQEAMGGKPVTERQTAFLRALGYAGPQPQDRATASALIDRLKREGGQL